MRRLPLLIVPLVLAALFGTTCSRTTPQVKTAGDADLTDASADMAVAGVPPRRAAAFASLPDRGNLLGYPSQRVERFEHASTWHRADVSEEHALRAVVTGEMAVAAPDGQPIRLRYQRHLEHPNGNWTWIGRNEHGEEAILTFGEKAVFGTIPRQGGEELRLATSDGRSWVVESDPGKQHHPDPKRPDYVVPPELAQSFASDQPVTASASMEALTPTAVGTTVDVALGYTTGFASELGGDSQAVTRLQHLVDIANQAYANSQINAQIRLVRTVPVNYPDATDNNDALAKLTGQSGSGSIPVDPAFNALRTARDQYGADLVSLVRRFRTPENEGCGVAWLIGGNQSRIDNSDAPWGYSVVSDDLDRGDLDETDNKTYVCRKETLAHELGHNMGQAHNSEDSDGTPGAHSYSYGYREVSTSGFYTVMAYRLADSSQKSIRYFANPNVLDAGTGRPTGVANASDNARSLSQTMPLIAAFRAAVMPGAATFDLYAIGKQGASGTTEVHVLGQQAGYQSFVLNQASALNRTGSDYTWRFQLADYNGDGFADLFAINRNGASGKTEVHILSGATRFQSFLLHAATALNPTGSDNGWIFRVGDFNVDGRPDIYAIARNGASGHTEVHVLNGADNFATFLAHIATPLPTTGTDGTWNFVFGDYNRDGRLDLYVVLKNNTGSGMTELHILDGAAGFSTFLLHAATALNMTGSDNTWDFKLGDHSGDGWLDLYAIGKQGASGRTEVHVLDGASTFREFSAHIATAVHQTGSDDAWEFELGSYR